MKIDIIIPTYNRAKIINKTLESILTQTSPDWECIVVDDFSDDNTREIVNGYVLNDSRFSYCLNNHQKGAQGARNTGLDHAINEWVIFFDSDNQMHANFVETMISYISKDIDVLACCSDVIDVKLGYTGRVMNPHCYGEIHNELFLGKCYVDFNQAVIKKSKLLEIGGLDEKCPSMQEWDTHIRLSKSSKYAMIDDSLVDYFVGGYDAISSNSKREVIGRLYILRKHIEEWKSKPQSLTKFSYQIFSILKRNEDETFVREKMQELKRLVPFFYVRIALGSIVSRLLK